MTTLLSIPFGTLLITYVFFINNSVVWYLPIETDMTMSMEFNLDFVNPNEEKYLGENEEVDGVKHPNSEEKSNKCSQRDNESSQAGQLRTHLEKHSGKKTKKCNQCDFASSQAGNLRTHIKHRKKCECGHHHSLFKGHNVIVHIVVLNCQKCNQCLKCHVSGHKNSPKLSTNLKHSKIVIID